MQEPCGAPTDWRDGKAYAPLLGADRSFHAWEWLRRLPPYRAAATRHPSEASSAEEFGLHVFEHPDRSVPEARPLWRRSVRTDVLEVAAARAAAPEDCFELKSFGPLATIVGDGDGGEHLLLSDGRRSIRLDIVEGSVRQGPVQLRYRIAGMASAEAPLLTLRRLLALHRCGRFPSALHPAETRATRFILMLRAYDALVSGARQREIASILLSADAGGERWRVRTPSLRSRVQRLVGSARAMAEGGYLSLLRS